MTLNVPLTQHSRPVDSLVCNPVNRPKSLEQNSGESKQRTHRGRHHLSYGTGFWVEIYGF